MRTFDGLVPTTALLTTVVYLCRHAEVIGAVGRMAYT